MISLDKDLSSKCSPTLGDPIADKDQRDPEEVLRPIGDDPLQKVAKHAVDKADHTPLRDVDGRQISAHFVADREQARGHFPLEEIKGGKEGRIDAQKSDSIRQGDRIVPPVLCGKEGPEEACQHDISDENGYRDEKEDAVEFILIIRLLYYPSEEQAAPHEDIPVEKGEGGAVLRRDDEMPEDIIPRGVSVV